MYLYSVYDSKGKYYDQPRLYRNSADASRAFESACKDQNSSFYKFPKDFILYEIGSFDQNTGTIMPLEKINHVCSAVDYAPIS